MGKTAILVDGGFYRKMANDIYGKQQPEEMVKSLTDHCYKHLRHKGNQQELYRIFYYDCPPLDKKVQHPMTGEMINFKQKDSYQTNMEFFELLRKQRKIALRLGRLSTTGSDYIIPSRTVKKIYNGGMSFDDLKPRHLKLDIHQKGVDMRIGVDIASLAYKKQVDQIVLIAGDSDFVPAAKVARREGVDFILDPMWNHVASDLSEHIDGLFSKCNKPKWLLAQEAAKAQREATEEQAMDKRTQNDLK
jgi:uncharacterized LabA/DUF88 family protein